MISYVKEIKMIKINDSNHSIKAVQLEIRRHKQDDTFPVMKIKENIKKGAFCTLKSNRLECFQSCYLLNFENSVTMYSTYSVISIYQNQKLQVSNIE